MIVRVEDAEFGDVAEKTEAREFRSQAWNVDVRPGHIGDRTYLRHG
jgi:hypothetical protein